MERWLLPRLEDVPQSLRQRILAAVRSGEMGEPAAGSAPQPGAPHPSSFPAARRLKEIGDRLLAEAMAHPAGRATALTLLAADALMTFACEAEAEAVGRTRRGAER